MTPSAAFVHQFGCDDWPDDWTGHDVEAWQRRQTDKETRVAIRLQEIVFTYDPAASFTAGEAEREAAILLTELAW